MLKNSHRVRVLNEKGPDLSYLLQFCCSYDISILRSGIKRIFDAQSSNTILKKNEMINIKEITEENFIDAFRLKPAEGPERFVSHPIRSLAQAYVYRNQCQPFGIYEEDVMVAMLGKTR